VPQKGAEMNENWNGYFATDKSAIERCKGGK